MFTAFSQVPLPSLPQFETRKALVIINLQNDSLYFKDGIFITKNREFVPRLKEMIPYFRRHGDIIWVCTHMGVLASAPSPDAAQVQRDTETQADKNRKAQKIKEQQMQDDARKEEAARRAKLEKIDPNASGHQDYPSFYPSSKSKDLMTRASAETRAEKRTADLQVMNDDKNEAFEKHLSKPRKGQQSRFYIAGTWGAEICDELLEVVDEEKDLIVYKHHYSAFDQTSLLTALRTKLVTEVYLCGCLTNVGVYSTAADAVQHGLQVTVVEDCLGYRSEEKHEEAMRQMADIMGVSGIDCEEIIEESGGRPVPDAETPGITLDELNLNAEGKDAEAGSMMAGVISGSQAEAASLLQNAAREASDQRTRQNEGLKATTRQQPFASAATADEPSHGRGKVVSREEIVPTPSPGPSAPRNRISWIASRSHTLGPNDSIGSGDSRVIYNVISFSTISDAFAQLKDEVSWQTMFHRTGQVPRLVAVQGEVGANGEEPIYRHPADESPPLLPFTPMVQKLRRELEAVLKQSFNHALIQLYRDGVDNISEHSDKVYSVMDQEMSMLTLTDAGYRTWLEHCQYEHRCPARHDPAY